METRKDIELLLSLYRTELDTHDKLHIEFIDWALYHLLVANKSKLPELDDYFHKAFRQVDVTDSGNTDAAIWVLLSGAKLFWPIFAKVTQKSGEHGEVEK